MNNGENIEDTFILIENMVANDEEGSLDQATLIQSTRRILSEELS